MEEISASGEFSVEIGQEVLYITERCVFVLTNKGIMITEIAPGISLEKKDILEKKCHSSH